MVHIIPLVGAAALFAQTAFAAAVPLRRSHDSGNSYNSNNNNYNGGNNNVYQQSSNQYDSSSNSYNNNNYGSNYNQYQQESNQYQQESNQYNNNMNMYESSSSSSENQYYNNQYETTTSSEYTSTVEEQSMETSTSQEYQQYQYDTSTESAMEEATSTSEYQSYETSSAQYSIPSYGSGSNNWNNYNNCVQQCQAQFGSAPSSMNMENQDSVSTGAIHTVLVAPDGAGLRYVPFAVNASIGDTIRYVWTTPANHTVTLSSALAICNKSGIAEQRDFVSGVRNASQGMQTFDVTVQTDQPQFFYCSVLQHCQKGMFGIINPGSNVGGTNTVGTMMSSLMQNNPQLQSAWNYMSANITGTTAENWGMSIPLDGIPESQYEEVAANVLFTQSTFALNQGMLEGNEGASNPDGSPVQIPQGLNVLLSNTASTPSADLPSPSSTVTPTATGSLTPVNAVTGAGFSTRSVSTWLAVVVGLAGWMLL